MAYEKYPQLSVDEIKTLVVDDKWIPALSASLQAEIDRLRLGGRGRPCRPVEEQILGWADPERDLSVALMNNGKPLIALELLAWLDVMRTISTRVPRDGSAA